ncbi:hypothetical protein N7320_02010 [Stutzerimonas stutzeri]|uniref:hypothetical protein n=1 Tax=Stutzerimonas stutzeri TaxID=316 RepID=UPI00244C8BA2|nr:hypothetical protein [Stutzerimonas stutzeri]MDH0100089.1 hypothetical protein [Stutzerimonas stutzeri]
MSNQQHVYTARNRDRASAGNYGAAAKYLSQTEERTLEKRLQESLRKAKAVRVANRLAQDMRTRTSSNPTECGFARIAFQLHAIREAENFDALLYRDRFADGMITAALTFGVITLAVFDRLSSLRNNAFAHRHRELLPCTP